MMKIVVLALCLLVAVFATEESAGKEKRGLAYATGLGYPAYSAYSGLYGGYGYGYPGYAGYYGYGGLGYAAAPLAYGYHGII